MTFVSVLMGTFQQPACTGAKSAQVGAYPGIPYKYVPGKPFRNIEAYKRISLRDERGIFPLSTIGPNLRKSSVDFQSIQDSLHLNFVTKDKVRSRTIAVAFTKKNVAFIFQVD